MARESFEIIERPERFIAGEPVTVIFRYTIAAEGLAEGSKLKLGLPSAGWGEPLVNHKRYWELDPGDRRRWLHYKRLNTTFEIESETGAYLEPYARHETRPGDTRCIQRWWITFEVIGADFSPGDVITITYGDTTWGEAGCTVQPVVEPRGDFSLFIQPPDYAPPGDEGLREAEGSPVWVAVEAGPPTRALLRLPTISASDDEPTARVYAMDRCCNPLWDKSCIPGGGAQAGLTRDYRMGFIIRPCIFRTRPGGSVVPPLQTTGQPTARWQDAYSLSSGGA
jgi:hypothetical protein